jgi:hypothetical protein
MAVDAATRERALQLITEAQAAGRKLTGAQLGRAIGRSDRYGRLLLRAFPTTGSSSDNGEPPDDHRPATPGCRAHVRQVGLPGPALASPCPGSRPDGAERAPLLVRRSRLRAGRQAPRTRNGLHDATRSRAQIAAWWRRWPQANIGLVTGELADGLDVDGPAGRAGCAPHRPAVAPTTTACQLRR